VFEYLPYVSEATLHYSQNEDLEALLADVKTPLEPIRRDNPNLYHAVEGAVRYIAQDVHDDQLRERIIEDIYAEMFIVLRLIDLAYGCERFAQQNSTIQETDN
jgi:hypothetical protein